MLAIILFILKLLGLVLLLLVGFIFLVLSLALFAPVKYKGSGYKSDDKLDVNVWLTYLNPLVKVKIHYLDSVTIQVKIFFFTIYPRKVKAKEVNKGSAKAKTAASTTTHVKEEKKRPKEARSVYDTIGFYVSLLQENKGLLSEVLQIILKALKTILPRDCHVNAVFGTGQADTTGFIYALYCSLSEYLPGEVLLGPSWIEARLEGDFFLQGKIRLYHFLSAVIRIISNKKVRLLYKKLRRV